MGGSVGRTPPNGTERRRLVIVRADRPAGMLAALGQLEAAAQERGQFSVLVDARPAGDAPAAARQGRMEQVRRLRALRPSMAAHAVGAAFVTTPEALAGQRRRARAARAVLGCPVEVFDSEAPALAWLRDHGVDTRGTAAGSR